MLNRFQLLPFALLGFACACAATDPIENPSDPKAADAKTMLLADFEGEHPKIDTLSGEWRTVNDNIMGGRSIGGGEIQDGVMVFKGSTNTNGGGFSSIRAGDKRWDLSDYDGLSARIKADGRRYVFHIQTGLRFGNSEVFYRGSFDTDRLIDGEGGASVEDTEWQDVFVPFEDFVPMIRGRDVSGRVGPLDASAIRGIGLMIDDGLDGAFRLEADWIKAAPTSEVPDPDDSSGDGQ
jgi:NADH dehydrogenase [ubiquinone] 1 alpha subcomplex assembly factor 1